MNNEEEERFIIKEKNFILKSDKNNEYEINLSIYNNDILNITIKSTKIIPSKKYGLSCTLEDLLNNRFFKIFINVDEIFRELETKISKSNIIEETSIIYLDIPIGLTIINDILLEIKQIENTNEDKINEINNEINNLKNENTLLKLQLKEYEEELSNNKEKLKFEETNNKLKNEIEKIKKENYLLILKLKEYEKKLNDNKEKLKLKDLNDNKEILDLIYDDYENIIEIELNSNGNEVIKIINDNIFDKDKTILLINNKKKEFRNIIESDKNKNYKIFILNKNKLKSLKEMFKNCKNITKINFIKFNTDNVEDMNSMFENCSLLKSIDNFKLNTKNVKDMSYMFFKCSQLTSIDMSKFNTENLKEMHSMFNGCSQLTSIDVSNFNTQKLEDFNRMFNDCSKLTTIYVSKFNRDIFSKIIDVTKLNLIIKK